MDKTCTLLPYVYEGSFVAPFRAHSWHRLIYFEAPFLAEHAPLCLILLFSNFEPSSERFWRFSDAKNVAKPVLPHVSTACVVEVSNLSRSFSLARALVSTASQLFDLSPHNVIVVDSEQIHELRFRSF